mgnify:CR=1 FL=1
MRRIGIWSFLRRRYITSDVLRRRDAGVVTERNARAVDKALDPRIARVAESQLHLGKSARLYDESTTGVHLSHRYAWIEANHKRASIALCCQPFGEHREDYV